ncbi:DUF2007 domain-containing protein [Noviherbaspirillum massiliense]|uniref:putative signal transducing protein n=1 Tax=Noviherbaspirillum massiliense TaxID=1465823 RepID=UPI00030C80E9|nr:DUF2007 domain-containing protein [Noviherbaspirillum massiliense]
MMKTLYQASNSIEAHMILHLLKQEGFTGWVEGEYLQGAVGELPATGLVRVVVAEEDYAAAKSLVDRWEATQPAEAPKPAASIKAGSASGYRFRALVAAFAAGVLLTYAFYRAPVSVDGIDHNHDGVLDDRWTSAPGGRVVREEVDRNLDGKADYIATYGRDGSVEMVETDDNFDGIFESRTTYRRGNPVLTETDTDGDGYRDFKTNFENGVVMSTEYINPTTGLPQKIDYFKLGKLTYSETDSDRDGRMDKRTRYNALGEAVSVQDIR